MLFVQLMMQLVDHDPGLSQGLSACRRDPIYPSSPPGYVSEIRLKQASAFHSVKERIKRSRSNSIAVMFKFFHHGKTKDRLMRSMDEDVDANESGKELPLLCSHNQRIPFCSRSTSYYRNSMV